jgi:hypothetical protein
MLAPSMLRHQPCKVIFVQIPHAPISKGFLSHAPAEVVEPTPHRFPPHWRPVKAWIANKWKYHQNPSEFPHRW